MTDTLHMTVSGEFITDLLRTWFWNEHRPMITIQKLFDCCQTTCDSDTKQQILTEILEGRKKLVGLNTFTLQEDNTNIRPLTEYLLKQETESGIQQITLDMQGNCRKYVDPWSTIKSMHADVLSMHGMPCTKEECIRYFTQIRKPYPDNDQFEYLTTPDKTPIIDTPTAGGLWLLRRPNTIWKACNHEISRIGTPEFWHNIYETIKDNPDFEYRNLRYLASLQPKTTYFNKHSDIEEIPPYNPYVRHSKEWAAYEYKQTKDLVYLLQPDDYITFEGLIAPNGDFYSCNFGHHTIKAYHLIRTIPQKCQIPESVYKTEHITIDNAMDTLIENGWCATRTVLYDSYLLPPLPKKPTKHQIESIIAAAQKHNKYINMQTLMSYYE